MDRSEEYQYLEALYKAAMTGVLKPTRNLNYTKSYFGNLMRFTLSEINGNGDIKRILPLLTTKNMRVSVDVIFKELEFFINGQTNNKILQEKGVKIWNANTSREYLDSVGLNHYDVGDCGPIYGFQWRHFGANYVDCNTNYDNCGIDQLEMVIKEIKNNPYSRRLLVTAWNPLKINEMCLPPCFMENTSVLTNNGYKYIQDVNVDDTLYTHTGKFEKINNKYITPYQGTIIRLKIKCHPNIIECTPQHPFYVDSNSQWVAAENLNNLSFIGMKINTNYNIPINDKIDFTNPNVWFVIGYFINNGWLDPIRKRIYFLFYNNDVYKKISRMVKMFEIQSIYTKCVVIDRKWYKIFKEFGFNSFNKIIPNWIQDAPIHFIEMFLKGLNADGMFNAFSLNIALSIQQLFLKIGTIVSVKKISKTIYQINIKNSDSYIKDNYCWYNVRNISKSYVEHVNVYNFDVNNDHTYVVENLVTHNCHVLFQFNVDPDINLMPKYLSCMIYQRSADIPLGMPFNIASYAALTHIIANLTGLIAKELVYVTGDTHIYENQLHLVPGQLYRKPYPFPELIFEFGIDNPKSINDYKSHHLKIINYKHWPNIIYPFSL